VISRGSVTCQTTCKLRSIKNSFLFKEFQKGSHSSWRNYILGVGRFQSRLHQAVYFDRTISPMAMRHHNWGGSLAVNIRPQIAKYFARFIEQKCEYVLKKLWRPIRCHPPVRAPFVSIDSANRWARKRH